MAAAYTPEPNSVNNICGAQRNTAKKLLTAAEAESSPRGVGGGNAVGIGLWHCGYESSLTNSYNAITRFIAEQYPPLNTRRQEYRGAQAERSFTGLFLEKTTGRRLTTAPCVPETNSVKLLTQT